MYGGGYGVLRNFTEIGDFEDWALTSGTPTIFSKSGDLLQIQTLYLTTTEFERELPQISTDLVINVSLIINLDVTGGSDYMLLRLYYNDSSYTTICDLDSDFEGKVSENLESGKFLAYIYLKLYVSAPGNQIDLTIFDEIFNGFIPQVGNYEDYTYYPQKRNEEITFTCFMENASRFGIIFITPDEEQHYFDMESHWSFSHFYFITETFYAQAVYRYMYVAWNYENWSETISSMCYLSTLENPYPHNARLALYSEIDGLGVDTNLFKYYGGESEEYSLVDFREFYGEWMPFFDRNITSAYLMDDYFHFGVNETNGFYTNIQDYPVMADLTMYNTFLFEIYIYEPIWLRIILNPGVSSDFDYYYHFNYNNSWLSVSIPIFNFTNFWKYENWLFRIGFVIYEEGRINLGNIRVAEWYNTSFEVQMLNYTQLKSESGEFQLYSNWNNYTSILTIPDLNIAGHTKENITIIDDEIVQLTQTNHFVGNESFTDDSIGEIPNSDKWTIFEESPGDFRIQETQSSHDKIVKIQGDTTIAYYSFSNDMSSGLVEFWVYWPVLLDGNSWAFSIIDNSVLHGIHLGVKQIGFLNYWIYVSNTYPTGAVIPDTPAAGHSTWRHVGIYFNTSVGWYVKIGGVRYPNSGYLDFAGVPELMSTVALWNMEQPTNYALFDAIDYNWSEGYFVGRNQLKVYCDNGFYQSKVYALEGHYQQYLEMNWGTLLKPNTNITIQYRTSENGVDWNEYSPPIVENITIDTELGGYVQFRWNLSTFEYLINTPQGYFLNLTYIAKYQWFEREYLIEMQFAYNESFYIQNIDINFVLMNFTVFENQSLFDLYVYNFTEEIFFAINAQNYSDFVLDSNWFNLSFFYLQINVNSSINYDFSYKLALLNNYTEVWNISSYSEKNYRLFSEGNRAYPDSLIFEQPEETLLIMDYFNNTIWRGIVEYGEYHPYKVIEIGLEIITLCFINNLNQSIIIEVERGLGVKIQVLLIPDSMIELKIFSSMYNVYIRNLEMQILMIDSVSCNRTERVVISVGERQEIVIPVWDWGQFWQFLFTTPLGITFLVLFVAILLVSIANYIKVRRLRAKMKRKSGVLLL